MIRTFAGMAIALAGLAAAPAPIVEVRHSTDPARRIEARAMLDADEIRLSGSVRLTLSVEGPGPLGVTPPRPLLTRPNLWRVRDDGLPIREVLTGGREKWSQTYRLSPLVPGEPAVAIGALTIRPAGEQDVRIEWQGEPTVSVRTSIDSPTAESLRPVTDIEALAPPPNVERGSRAWLFAVVPLLLVLSAIGVFLGRRKRPRGSVRDAQWARNELSSPDLTPDHCAEVLRQYLSHRFGMPAETRTTPELMVGLGADGRLPPAAVAEWRGFLEECDTARFSGTGATVSGLADRAKALIDAAESQIATQPEQSAGPSSA